MADEGNLAVAQRLYQAFEERDPQGILAALGPDFRGVVAAYTGKARQTGRPHDAAFVHLLRFANGAIIELVQVTDTARWHEALAS